MVISDHTLDKASRVQARGLDRLAAWLRYRCYEGIPIDHAEHALRTRINAVTW